MLHSKLSRVNLILPAVCIVSALLPFAALASTPSMSPRYVVSTTIELPGAARWDYLHMDAQSRRLYVAQGNQVTVVDVDKGKVIGAVLPTPGVHGVAIDHRDGLGFASAGGMNAVVVFKLSTLSVIKSIPVGRMPDCIIYDPNTNRVFAFDGGSNEASVIDCKSQSLIGEIPLDGRPEFAVAGNNGRIYVNIESKSQVAKIDARKLRVTAVWSLAPGHGPSGITVDPRNHLVFSTCHNGMMTVLNDQTGQVIATPRIGNGPDAAGFDKALGLAFSSNGDGTISVIGNGPSGKLSTLATVTTEPGARTMAVDDMTHDLLVCTARPDPKPMPAGTPFWRKPYLRNTLHILVLRPTRH